MYLQRQITKIQEQNAKWSACWRGNIKRRKDKPCHWMHKLSTQTMHSLSVVKSYYKGWRHHFKRLLQNIQEAFRTFENWPDFSHFKCIGKYTSSLLCITNMWQNRANYFEYLISSHSETELLIIDIRPYCTPIRTLGNWSVHKHSLNYNDIITEATGDDIWSSLIPSTLACTD